MPGRDINAAVVSRPARIPVVPVMAVEGRLGGMFPHEQQERQRLGHLSLQPVRQDSGLWCTQLAVPSVSVWRSSRSAAVRPGSGNEDERQSGRPVQLSIMRLWSEVLHCCSVTLDETDVGVE